MCVLQAKKMSQVLKSRNHGGLDEAGSVQEDVDSDASASPRLVISSPPAGSHPLGGGSPMGGITVPLSSHLTNLRNGTSSPRQILQSTPALAGRYVPLQPHQVQQLQLQHQQQLQQQQQQQQQQQLLQSQHQHLSSSSPLSIPASRLPKVTPTVGLAMANGVTAAVAVEGGGRGEQSNAAEYILNRVPGTDNRVLLSSGRYATIDPSMLGPINALMAVANQRQLPTPESDMQHLGTKQPPDRATQVGSPRQQQPKPAVPALLPPEPAKKPRRRRKVAAAVKAGGAEAGPEKTPKLVSKRVSSPSRKALPEKVAISRSESASVLEGLAKKVRRNSVDFQGVDKAMSEHAMPVLIKEGEGVAAHSLAV